MVAYEVAHQTPVLIGGLGLPISLPPLSRRRVVVAWRRPARPSALESRPGTGDKDVTARARGPSSASRQRRHFSATIIQLCQMTKSGGRVVKAVKMGREGRRGKGAEKRRCTMERRREAG